MPGGVEQGDGPAAGRAGKNGGFTVERPVNAPKALILGFVHPPV
jgi:hypothetical protein